MKEYSGNPFEQVPTIDYLREDLESRREQYRIFLGIVDVSDSEKPIVHIEGILERGDEDPLYYEEEKEGVHVGLPAIKLWIDQIRRANPEYSHLEMVGDVHTHPILPQQFRGVYSPSQEDIDDIVKHYESGVLSPNKPFIFAIAAPDELGQTMYAFYRIVKKGNKYSYKSIP